MTIPVDAPRVEVKLIKLVGRKDGVSQRYSGAVREIDLTPFLGESGVVQTNKAMGEAAGGFQIAFPDKLEASSVDSVYAMVEPMDMVEIRAARQPHRYAGAKLPLIMRGFVTSIHRSEAMHQDQPDRSVVIAGHDFGKLLLMHRVYYEIDYALGSPFLSTFSLEAHLGMEARVYGVSDFVEQVVAKVVNPKIEALSAFSDRHVAKFEVRATVPDGLVTPFSINCNRKTVWELLLSGTDIPWNELFVEDEEDGPVLIFRPVPYKDLAGAYIMPGAGDPGSIAVTDREVSDLGTQRSDARVANFFWVPPGRSMLDTSFDVATATLQKGKAFDFSYGNNRPELYGIKMMEVGSGLLPGSISAVPNQVAKEARSAANAEVVQWHEKRANELKLMNRDNSVLEEGAMTVAGRETYKIGRYLKLQRGGMASEAYIVGVRHSVAPLALWTTSLQVIRGTGFLERLKHAGSPYIAEGRTGPYT